MRLQKESISRHVVFDEKCKGDRLEDLKERV